MSRVLLSRRLTRFALLAAVAAAAIWQITPATADDVRQTTSLRLVPADAAVYGAGLRYGEIFEAFIRSKAAKKITELGVYEMMRDQMKQPLAQFQEALSDPANKQLYDLVLEMVSDEVFMYGGSQWAEMGQLMQELNGARQIGQIMGALGELGVGPGSGNAELDQLRAMLLALQESADSLEVPDTVIGFKIKSKDAARSQIQRLEVLLTAALADVEELRGHLTREKIGGEEFLTLAVDGSSVPWDEIPWEEVEEEEGQFDKLIDRLKKLEAVISLGIFQDYLVLSVGKTSEHLQRLGQGSLLADREELAPLQKFADRRMVGISYASKEMSAASTVNSQDIEGLAEFAESMIPEELDDDVRKRIRADLAELAEDTKGSLTEPGATLEFSFLTDNGFEGYHYSWGGAPGLDGSQPLTLLEHVGGNPILFVVARAAAAPGEYDLMVKWLKRLYGYFEDFALPELDDDQRQQFAEFKKGALPLLKRLDEANRKQLGPALKDGQWGLVIDARTTSKQWNMAMPISNIPLPMLELGLVLGVSDAELLRQGVATYVDVTNKLLALLHKMEPDEFPELQVPPPQTRDIGVGTEYFFPLPVLLGMDQELAPSAGLSDRVAAMTYTHQHTRRLLTATPLAVGSPPLAETDRPLAAAFSFNFAALMHAVEPWVDYGFDLALQDYDPAEDSAPLPAIRDQVKDVLEILRCFRGYSSASHFEEGALVTHSEWNFVDLK